MGRGGRHEKGLLPISTGRRPNGFFQPPPLFAPPMPGPHTLLAPDRREACHAPVCVQGVDSHEDDHDHGSSARHKL